MWPFAQNIEKLVEIGDVAGLGKLAGGARKAATRQQALEAIEAQGEDALLSYEAFLSSRHPRTYGKLFRQAAAMSGAGSLRAFLRIAQHAAGMADEGTTSPGEAWLASGGLETVRERCERALEEDPQRAMSALLAEIARAPAVCACLLAKQLAEQPFPLQAEWLWDLGADATSALVRAYIGEDRGERRRALVPLLTLSPDSRSSLSKAQPQIVRLALEPSPASIADLLRSLRKMAPSVRNMVVSELAACAGRSDSWNQALAELLRAQPTADFPESLWTDLLLALGRRRSAARMVLETALVVAPLVRRRAIAPFLRKSGWQPGSDPVSIAYFVTQENYEACLRVGQAAIDPLLREMAILTDPKVCSHVTRVLEQLGWVPDGGPAEAWLRAREGDIEGCAAQGNVAKVPLENSFRAIDWRLAARLTAACSEGCPRERREALVAVLALNPRNDRLLASAQSKIAARLVADGMEAYSEIDAGLRNAHRTARGELIGMLGEPAGHPLVQHFLRLDASDDEQLGSIQADLIETLGHRGGPALAILTAALVPAQRELRQLIAYMLESVGWRPGPDLTGVAYHIGMEDYESCLDCGKDAIDPLVAELTLLTDPEASDGVLTVLELLGWEPSGGTAKAWSLARKGDIEGCAAIGSDATQVLENNFEAISARLAARLTDAFTKGSAKEKRIALVALLGLHPGTDALFASAQRRVVSSLAAHGPAATGELGRALRTAPPTVRVVIAEQLCETANLWLAAYFLRQDGTCDERLATAQAVIVEALGRRGGDALLVLTAALVEVGRALQQSIAHTLRRARWKPGADRTGIAYHIGLGDYEACRVAGPVAIEALLDELAALRDPNACGKILTALEAVGWKPDGGLAEAWLLSIEGDIEGCAALGSAAVPALVNCYKAVDAVRAANLAESCSAGSDKDKRAALTALLELDPRSDGLFIAAQRSIITSVVTEGLTGSADLGRALRRAPPSVRSRVISALCEPANRALADHFLIHDTCHDGKLTDTQAGLIEALGQRGGLALTTLAAALVPARRELRQQIASMLKSVGWRPSQDRVGIAYHIGLEDYEACLDEGPEAIEPLVAELVVLTDPNVSGDVLAVLELLGWEPSGGPAEAWWRASRGDIEGCASLGSVAVVPLMNSYEAIDAERAAHLVEACTGARIEKRREVLAGLLMLHPGCDSIFDPGTASLFDVAQDNIASSLATLGPGTVAVLTASLREAPIPAHTRIADAICRPAGRDKSWDRAIAVVLGREQAGSSRGDLRVALVKSLAGQGDRAASVFSLALDLKNSAGRGLANLILEKNAKSDEQLRIAQTEVIWSLARQGASAVAVLWDMLEAVHAAVRPRITSVLADQAGTSPEWDAALLPLIAQEHVPAVHVRAQSKLVRALAMRGEAVKPLLTKALCTASVKGRRRLAPQLREARWAPPKGHGAAAYHVALGEYERCMGSEAAPFLVTELESLADSASCWKVSRILASLDWEATQGRAAAWVLLQRGDIEGCAGLGSVAVDVLVHSLRDRKELRRSVAKALEMLHWEPTPDAVGAYFLIETGASPERVAAIGAAAARPLMEQLEQRGVVRAATAGEALVLLGKHGLAALAGNLQTDAHDRPTRETVLSLMAQSMGADTFATLSGAGMFTRPQARGAGRRSQLDSPTEAALTRGLDQLAEAFMVGDGRARTSIVEMMERLHGRSGLHLAKLLISSASPVVAAAVRRHHKGGWLNDEAKVALLDNAVRLGGRHQDHARRVNYYTEGREYNDTWIQCEGRRVGWVETRRHTDYEEHTDEYVRQSCPLLPF